MDKNGHNLQVSMLNKRRTSVGSLSSRKRNNNSMSYDVASSSNYPSYMKTPQRKLRPVAGGSWDDNSLGHGSVVARMRRDRNNAIRRTQASSTYTNTDASASVASTLNLINTSDLAPPWHDDDLFPWDDELYYHDAVNGRGCGVGGGRTSAATKRSAGSLCNISSPNNRLLCEGAYSYRPWDSQSIPESRRRMMREKLRSSFTSANHQHSSPTSGCASIASSDITDFSSSFVTGGGVSGGGNSSSSGGGGGGNHFTSASLHNHHMSSIDNDSNFFDSDSLFSDSYGVLDSYTGGYGGGGDSGFNTDIFSMLEEGSISCRTPFPNGDWPDSISELNFDCSNEQPYEKSSNITNCDAHSDIMPSSTSTCAHDKNKMKKRKIRTQSGGRGDMQKLAYPPVASAVPAIIETDVDPNKIEEEEDIEEAKMPQDDDEKMEEQKEAEQIAQITEKLMTSRQQCHMNDVDESDMLMTSSAFYDVTPPMAVVPTVHPPAPTIEAHHHHNHHHHLHQHQQPVVTPAPSPAVINLQLDLNLCGSDVTNVVINSVRAQRHHQQQKQTYSFSSNAAGGVVRDDSTPSSPALKKAFKVSAAAANGGNGIQHHHHVTSTPVRVPITLNLKGWDYMTQHEREGFVERLCHKISTTMSIEEQMDIIRIIEGEKSSGSGGGMAKSGHVTTAAACASGVNERTTTAAAAARRIQQRHNNKYNLPFRVSVDDIDSCRLTKLISYLDTHKGPGGLAGLFSATHHHHYTSSTTTNRGSAVINQAANNSSSAAMNNCAAAVNGGGGGLRRSNSDSDLNKNQSHQKSSSSTSKQPKSNRRSNKRASHKQQQQAQQALELQQQQQEQQQDDETVAHKEQQLAKERRSGLFVNEQKLKIEKAESGDDDIDIV